MRQNYNSIPPLRDTLLWWAKSASGVRGTSHLRAHQPDRLVCLLISAITPLLLSSFLDPVHVMIGPVNGTLQLREIALRRVDMRLITDIFP